MSSKPLNKERRIFIDTNVLIGCYCNLPHDKAAMQYLFSLRNHELYTSVLAIAQTISTLQGNKKIKAPREKVIEYVNHLAAKIKFVGFADKDIEKACIMPNKDIEDNIQYVIGSKLRCYYYVTNNVNDYKYNSVLAVEPSHVYTIDT